MNAEMNIKLNDDKSITINNVRYIPDFWGEAKASAKPEKRHTGIEEPERDDSVCYIDGDGILETYDYSSGSLKTNISGVELQLTNSYAPIEIEPRKYASLWRNTRLSIMQGL